MGKILLLFVFSFIGGRTSTMKERGSAARQETCNGPKSPGDDRVLIVRAFNLRPRAASRGPGSGATEQACQPVRGAPRTRPVHPFRSHAEHARRAGGAKHPATKDTCRDEQAHRGTCEKALESLSDSGGYGAAGQAPKTAGEGTARTRLTRVPLTRVPQRKPLVAGFSAGHPFFGLPNPRNWSILLCTRFLLYVPEFYSSQ